LAINYLSVYLIVSNNSIGYKLCRHITKALQKYNQQAQKLQPPHPTLSWQQVVDYTFLGEFDLLRNSRRDVHNEDWAKSECHELTTRYMELSHMREEIDQLNVEVKCLRTYMHYEALDYEAAISNLAVTDEALTTEVSQWWCMCHAINALHKQCLAQVFAIPGFSGSTELGTPLLLSRQSMPVGAHGKEIGVLGRSDENVAQEVLSAECTGLCNVIEEEQHDMDAFTVFVDTLDM